MREWYYISNNGEQVGPYEETQIISFLANGELSPETLVCTKGMSEWLPAKSLEWFFPQNNQTNKLERLKSSQSFLESHGREKSNFKLHEPLPTAILSFFFTPLLGALMISSNWKKLNKPENASKTMMIFYAYLVVLVASYFAPPLVIFPIIIVLILIGFWFNVHHHSKYLKEHNIHYTSKSVVKPIVCGLGIIITSYSITIYSKWDFLKAEFTKAFAEAQQQALDRQQKSFTQDDLSKLKQTLSSDIEKLYSKNTNGTSIDKFELIKNPKNIGEKMTNVMRTRYKEIIDLDKNYDQDLNKIGFYSLMDLERIQKPGSIKETKTLIDSAIKSATKHKRLNLESYDRVIDGITKLSNGLTDETRTKGNNNRKTISEACELEITLIEKMGEIVMHLHETSGDWELQDDITVFSNDNNLDKYNSLWSQFDELSIKQDELNELMEKKMKAD